MVKATFRNLHSSQKLFPQQGITTASVSSSPHKEQSSSFGAGGAETVFTGFGSGRNGGLSFLPCLYAILKCFKKIRAQN